MFTMNPSLRKLSLLQTLLVFGIVAIVLPELVVGAPLVGSLVTQKFFNDIINQASPTCDGKLFYTRAAFLNAAKSFPYFGNYQSDVASKREIASFFAHVTYETNYFCHKEEVKTSRYPYCSIKGCPKYPCKAGKSYYGRGPLQLTGNCNYGAAGSYLGLDLLKQPELVATNPTVSFKTALWYWNTNVRPVFGKGFGATIKAINPRECNGGNPNAIANRNMFYKRYCTQFGVTPGPNLSC